MVNRKIKIIGILILSLGCLFTTACSTRGEAADPDQWGYSCTVTYDALNGMINAREVRVTYYLPNSYVFEPSGSSNMLVEPSRDGYILAGWYRNKSTSTDPSVQEYDFSPSDRWDFNTDRVQSDMTLYARWLPRGRVDYVDAATDAVLFSKNITSESPIQPLSDSVLKLKAPDGATLSGYYADDACTTEYDFKSYTHVDPNPTEADLYAQLYEMFPQYIEQIEFIEPDEEEIAANTDTSWLFLNRMGYNLLTTDEAAIEQIRIAKDQLVETAIQNYLGNTANRVVYLKFSEGNYIVVEDAGDLKIGTKYGFFDFDADGNPITGYIFNADVDLAGITLSMSDSFTGIINGNGHTISNLTISVSSKKIDKDKEKAIALAAVMDGATINDLTFKDAALQMQVNSGIRVSGGLLAVSAANVTLNSCHFDGMMISSGDGDDGKARYTLGDLFAEYEDCTFNGCTAQGLEISVARPDRLVLSLFELADEPQPLADGAGSDTPEP